MGEGTTGEPRRSRMTGSAAKRVDRCLREFVWIWRTPVILTPGACEREVAHTGFG